MNNYLQLKSALETAIRKQERGYIFAYPDKRAWQPIADSDAFVGSAWDDYGGPIGIYLHVPYCPRRKAPRSIPRNITRRIYDGMNTRCGYCNLFSLPIAADADARAHTLDDYVGTLCREIDLAGSLLKGRDITPSSIYFGGGTPTLLGALQFQTILQQLGHCFGAIPPGTEVSLEASPETVNCEYLSDLVDLGFNRISFGVQSFNPRELEYLGRDYSPDMGAQAIERALQAGFSNVNGDLMVGLPHQTDASFQESLNVMLQAKPPTLTLYQYLHRPVTRFDQEAALGILPIVREDHHAVVANRLDAAARLLAASGYVRESVNRWTRPGLGGYEQQVHEYQLVPTLGLGPSARTYAPNGHYSTDYAVNCRAVANIIMVWKQRIQKGVSAATSGFAFSADEQERRHVLFRLMSRAGVDCKEYQAKFDHDPEAKFEAELKVLADLDLTEVTDSGNLRFNQPGLAHSGAIARICFFSDTVRHRLTNYVHS